MFTAGYELGLEIKQSTLRLWAWGGVVVKALRY